MGGEVLQRRWVYAQDADDYVGAPRELIVDIDNWDMALHDGQTPGGHPLAKRSELGGLAIGAEVEEALALKADRGEIAPVFATTYEAGTVGAADSGKSYLLADIATLPVLPIAPVEDLPVGWSITVRAMGAPTGFQTAKLHITSGAGVFVFYGKNLGADFFLIGYGEAFRLTRIADGVLLVEKIVDPERRRAVLGWSGHSSWNSGPTSWGPLPLSVHSGDQHIVQRQNGGGPVAVSGLYNVTGFYYCNVQVSGQTAYGYAMLDLAGQRHSYRYGYFNYLDAETMTLSDTVFLNQGEVINYQMLMSSAYLYYHPASSEMTITLVGR